MRLALIPPALLALTACYDFQGDRARLGFSTDATLDGARPWTPDTPLAEGARPRLSVSEILATETEPQGVVRFEGSRSIGLDPEENDVYVSGSGKGWVGVEADGTRDDFTVRWVRAESGVFVDPIAAAIGGDAPLDSLVLVEGGRTSVRYTLHDKRGRELGYVFDQLKVSGSVLTADYGFLAVVGGEPGVHELVVQWPGARPSRLDVEVIEADDIDGLGLERLSVEDECVLHAILTKGDQRVRGGTGFRWSHTDTDEPFAPCDDDVDVQWGDSAVGT